MQNVQQWPEKEARKAKKKGAISQSPWKISLRRRKTSLKAVTRWAVDKNLNQDVRADTMRELWHKLWGKWGLPDERLNTCTGTATDTHRQVHGSVPTLRMNSVTSLSQLKLFFSPPFCFRLLHKVKRAWAFCSASQYFILLLPPLTLPTPTLSILGMAVEILADTHASPSLPKGAGDRLQTTI